jgi:hypothetical protein
MEKLGLSAPWTTYYKQIKALFAEDKDIKVIFDQDSCAIKLFVEDAEKADALTKLLPVEKAFGNVTVKIMVIPANAPLAESRASLVEKAFKGNPAVSTIFSVEGIFGNPINYVAFVPKVVQFFNDDLSDLHGNCSTLYQELAKEVIGQEGGIYFCTDVPTENVNKPLGEWP